MAARDGRARDRHLAYPGRATVHHIVPANRGEAAACCGGSLGSVLRPARAVGIHNATVPRDPFEAKGSEARDFRGPQGGARMSKAVRNDCAAPQAFVVLGLLGQYSLKPLGVRNGMGTLLGGDVGEEGAVPVSVPCSVLLPAPAHEDEFVASAVPDSAADNGVEGLHGRPHPSSGAEPTARLFGGAEEGSPSSRPAPR